MKAPAARAAYARQVADYFASGLGLSTDEVFETSRRQLPVLARQLCYIHLRERAGWRLEEIATAFGRDHSTVWSQITAGERAVAYEIDLQRLLRAAPMPHERVFTDTTLVQAYTEFTRLLAETMAAKERLEQLIADEAPSRVVAG
jgi:hypothetical protein